MMRCIVQYFELAKKAIVETSKSNNKIMYAYLANQTKPLFDKLKKMKFESPKQTPKDLNNYFIEFVNEIEAGFRKLMER